MPRANLTTQKFGILTPIRIASRNRRNVPMWECKCDCGQLIIANHDNLVSGHTQSCGCLKHFPSPTRIDVTNQRFGMLVAVEYIGLHKNKETLWLFRCDCGSEYVGRLNRVKAGDVNSCGCREGATTHGLSQTEAYQVHKGMVHRCYNPKARNSHRYGERGIDICKRWLLVENFIMDMGQPPKGLTIERINNDGGYWCGHCEECLALNRLSNCKWDTYTNQARNKSSNHPITACGKTMLLVEWVAETGIPKSTIMNRLYRGWSEERAVTEPVATKHRKHSTC